MAQISGIAAILASVAACDDWHQLMELKNVIEKRLIDVPTPKPTAAEVKARFSGVKTVKLVGLSDRFLNGMEVEVAEVKQTNLVVLINKYGTPQRTRIPAVCAIPVGR